MGNKKLYVAVAAQIHRSNELAGERLDRRESVKVQDSNLLLAEGLADVFSVNDRFERDKFMQACGFAVMVSA